MFEGEDEAEAEHELGDELGDSDGAGHHEQTALGEAGPHFLKDEEYASYGRTEGRRHACRRSGGYVDMSRHGVICSIVSDLTTAVENKESCVEERNKEYGLWKFSTVGVVFKQEDLENKLLK
jgi:hypothetical protein